MNEARSTISKIFNGEPRSYTRFNLTQNMEGENSQVEMKLSSDMDEETGNATGEHNGYPHGCNPATVLKPRHSPRNVCFVVIATLLVFIIGYLIGYLTKNQEPLITPVPVEPARDFQSVEEPDLDWSDIKTLLGQKLDETSLETAFSEFSRGEHDAGSDGDNALASRVLARFKSYGMKSWNDEHYVRLQGPPRTDANRVVFAGEEIGRPQAYLAYSATGTPEGRLVYAHYGQADDFQTVQDLNTPVNGSVVLLRAGKISFAEKVSNAAKLNAVAVLIYLDPADYNIETNIELYGHVHLGSGDPYSPGFPSFYHAQFPPTPSSGLPQILAQTITASMATKLFSKMSGPKAPSFWNGGLGTTYKLGGDGDLVTVEVHNVPVEKKIYNVFGVIKGFVDPDRYVVIGAQRDSWGPGFAKSTVGTSILMELARAISDMEANDGFKPRRSIIFASWSAGEYGSVGATEWLEGYLSSLYLKAFTYINLDGVVAGSQAFQASASPLLYSLIEKTLKEVNSPTSPSRTLYDQVAGASWEKSVMVPMKTDDAAYPFMAFSGIPSVSFRFTKSSGEYPYFGTMLDTREKLNIVTEYATTQVAIAAAQVAGQMALRLIHDHILLLDVERYKIKIQAHVSQISRRLFELKASQILPETLSSQWLITAAGSYGRAARTVASAIKESDLTDVEVCRKINDRIMRVEKDLLSPYVSPKVMPFRHIFAGAGPHTMGSLIDQLKALKNRSPESDVEAFQSQFALATWTVQGCSNALAGDIWVLDNVV